MSYCKNKHLAAMKMLEAYGSSIQGYYLDDTKTNLAALRECRVAVEKMLEPYYSGPNGEQHD